MVFCIFVMRFEIALRNFLFFSIFAYICIRFLFLFECGSYMLYGWNYAKFSCCSLCDVSSLVLFSYFEMHEGITMLPLFLLMQLYFLELTIFIAFFLFFFVINFGVRSSSHNLHTICFHLYFKIIQTENENCFSFRIFFYLCIPVLSYENKCWITSTYMWRKRFPLDKIEFIIFAWNGLFCRLFILFVVRFYPRKFFTAEKITRQK